MSQSKKRSKPFSVTIVYSGQDVTYADVSFERTTYVAPTFERAEQIADDLQRTSSGYDSITIHQGMRIVGVRFEQTQGGK